MSEQPVLLIRTDATPHIGTGHVMRCLALAQAWQTAGGGVVFAMATAPEGLRARLAEEGFDYIMLGTTEPGSIDDATRTMHISRQQRAQYIVIDGYHFGSGFQQALKEAHFTLLYVDDYEQADYYAADLLLNQNLYAIGMSYPARAPSTQLLLGTDYALLRREFWPWREWQRETAPLAQHVLVTLGGSDPHNTTLTVIRALKLLLAERRSGAEGQAQHTDLNVRIVVGPANAYRQTLVDEIGQDTETFHLLTAVRDMPALMAWADMAISAAGSTCWEMAFMGVPLLTVILADNQQYIASSLADADIAIDMGWYSALHVESLAAYVAKLMNDLDRRRAMSARGRQLVDGLGAQRVIELLWSMHD
jgi:UDP-2,4-diacetamido-2,4,6-trideoxy-beta-L-altropyranose hydrolase